MPARKLRDYYEQPWTYVVRELHSRTDDPPRVLLGTNDPHVALEFCQMYPRSAYVLNSETDEIVHQNYSN